MHNKGMVVSLSYSIFFPAIIWRYYEETHKKKEPLAIVNCKIVVTGESQCSLQDPVSNL